jgi:hypothetical protein
MRVPAVVQPQTDDDTPASPLTPFGELLEFLDNVPGILRQLQESSRPGSIHIRLGSLKPQSKLRIPSGETAWEPDMSMLLKSKPVELASFDCCI